MRSVARCMNTIAQKIDPSVIAFALDQSYSAVLMTDAYTGEGGHRIVFGNQAFLQMSGYSEEELLGKNPRIMQGPATNPEVIERLRQCVREGTFFKVQRLIIARMDGLIPLNGASQQYAILQARSRISFLYSKISAA